MTAPRRPSVLVVDDDADMVFALRRNLERDGFDVLAATDGEAALASVHKYRPEVVLLDLMLPKIDGFRVLRTLRLEGDTTPMLLLTARSAETDKVYGFRVGADDYVTKPFSLNELVLRIRALLRRAARHEPRAVDEPRVMQVGEIEIDVAARVVRRAGAEVALSPRAYELLLALSRRAGSVARREELMSEVWGYADGVTSRTLDTHIAELRRKLEPAASQPRHILTAWRVGYRLVP